MKRRFLLSPGLSWSFGVLLFLEMALALDAATNLRGSLGIHDPSAVIKCGNRYYVFGPDRASSQNLPPTKLIGSPGRACLPVRRVGLRTCRLSPELLFGRRTSPFSKGNIISIMPAQLSAARFRESGWRQPPRLIPTTQIIIGPIKAR